MKLVGHAIILFGLLLSAFQAHSGTYPTYFHTWMLEIAYANQAPDYLKMPQGHDEKHADEFGTMLTARSGLGRPRPLELDFRYWSQGTAVRVNVSLIFDPSANSSGAEKKSLVGNYTVRPGESVIVSQHGQFGLQPVQIKIVSSKVAGATPPQIFNETSSVAIEKIDQDRAEYRLLLRNNSDRAVHAIVISVFDGNGRCHMHDFHAWFGGLIAPGDTVEFPLRFPLSADDSGVVGADGMSCSYESSAADALAMRTDPIGTGVPQVVIEAVDFEDGSYEGDDQKAAMLAAKRLGGKIERQRITALVDKQLISGQPDGLVELAAVQSALKAFPDRAEPADVDAIMARFTTVPDTAKELIKQDIRGGMMMEKGMVLRNLQMYLFELSKGLTSRPSLRRWWELTKGSCDFLAPRSCPGGSG